VGTPEVLAAVLATAGVVFGLPQLEVSIRLALSEDTHRARSETLAGTEYTLVGMMSRVYEQEF
jgi:hypothetical protein